jgi:endonuclease/exonuclease/phosphatase family metal-dependent hydrolase
MKITSKVTIISCTILIILATFFISNKPSNESQIINKLPDNQPTQTGAIKVANWNLQIFGESKASKPDLMAKYAQEIGKYDIIFVQEIRDSSGAAFSKLCFLLPQYNCKVSSRAGQTSSKEQYGIIYRKGVKLLSMTDFNPQYQGDFQRPPILAVFNLTHYDLKVYNIHTDPDNVSAELHILESIVDPSGNVMVLGDLNADCSYYNPSVSPEFDSWFWVIGDGEDTTIASTDCAYDRILLNSDAKNEFLGFGIDKNITSGVSDHYLVWAEMKAS